MYNIRHKAMAAILAFAMILSLVVPAYAEPDAAVSESVDTDIAKENTAQDNTGEDKAAPVEEQEQMDEVQAEEGEAAEDVEEAIPYILMLPAVEDVSYSYDEAHYSEEFSDPDFTVLLYEAGEDVSIKVKSDLKYELVGALDGSVFLAADMVKKGKAQFTMPENDLMVNFIIPEVKEPEVKEPEVQAPAVEEPEVKEPEEQEPVDEVQDAEVSDEVQDAEVTDEAQDAEATDGIQDEEVSDEVQDAEVTDEVQDAEVSDEVQDAEVTDEVQDAEVTDEVQDAEVTGEVQDAEVSDEVQDADVTDEVQDAEVSDEVQDTEVSDEIQDTEVTDEVQDAEVSDEVQDAEVSDEVQDAEVTDEAQNAEVTDEVQDTEVTDEVQDAEVTDEVQDAEVADEVQDAEVTDEVQDAEVSDEVQDTEAADEAQNAETETVTVMTLKVNVGDKDFDPASDFRNLDFDTELFDISYISGDVDVMSAGTYETVYLVTSKETGHDFQAVRPVEVVEMAETDEKDGKYHIYTMDDNQASICFDGESYQAGETVSFQVMADNGFMITDVIATQCESNEDALAMGEDVPLEKVDGVSTEDSVAAAMNLRASAVGVEEENLEASEQLGLNGDVMATFSFEMPESDVFVRAATQSGIMALAEDEDPVPDKFKLNIGTRYEAPAVLRNGDAATSYKTVIFIDEDGNTTKRVAYCIEPSKGAPGSGTTYNKDTAQLLGDSSLLAKGLFYLFGGPGWGKDIPYEVDGVEHTVNFKKVMSDAGCSNESNYYTMAHYVLSYIYLDGTNNWNSNDAARNVLNSKGVKLVQDIVKLLRKCDKPVTKLGKSALSAEYVSGGGSKPFITSSTSYTAIEGNAAKVVVPAMVTLVNETQGTSGTNKTMTIQPGDKFHFEISKDYDGPKEFTLEFRCSYAVDFSAFSLKFSGKQDIGFSYYSGDKTLYLAIGVDESPGQAYLMKVNADTGSSKLPAGDGNYSLQGAEYTVYTDKACTKKAGCSKLITKPSGRSNTVELFEGTYYVKETLAPDGFVKNDKVLTVKVVNGETTVIEAEDEPKRGQIDLVKYPQPALYSLQGAVYKVYLDEDCTKQARTANGDLAALVTDKNGKASLGDLYFSTYYIKETKSPDCGNFKLDPTVHEAVVNHSTSVSTTKVTSEDDLRKGELTIHKSLECMQGMSKEELDALYDSGVLAIDFTLTHEKHGDGTYDKDETQKTLHADQYGNGTEKDLLYGKWTIEEVNPPKYYRGMTPEVVEISAKNNGAAEFSVVNRPKVDFIQILKKDAETGNPVKHSSATFQILDTWNHPVSLLVKGAASPTKKFTTDGEGEVKFDEKIKAGKYTLVELEAPSGYDKFATGIPFEVIGDIGIVVSVTCTDKPIPGKAQVLKKDAASGNIAGAGFVFEVYAAEDIVDGSGAVRNGLKKGSLVDTVTTGANGIATTKDLYVGSYYFKEKSAPKGYLVGNGNYPFAIQPQKQAEPVRVEASDTPVMRPIQVTKLDAASKTPAGKGFQFNIVAKSVVDGSGNVRKGYENGTVLQTLITGDNGTAVSKDLYCGTYTVQETVTQNGYEMNRNVYEVIVSDQGVEENKKPVTQVIEDNPVMRPIRVAKLDADSKNQAGEGFVFQVAAKQVLDASGAVRKGFETGTVVDTITTGKTGTAESKKLYCGTYIVTETKAPYGYQLNHSPYEVVISDKGVEENKEPVQQVVEDNPVMRPIKVTKLDADSKNPAGGNFEFEVVAKSVLDGSGNVREGYEEGTVIDTLVTDENGEATSKDLYCGTYLVRETVNQYGYEMNETVYEVTVTDGGVEENKKPVQQVVEDNPVLRPIKVTKLDADSKNSPGENFEFEVVAKSILDGSGNVREGYEEGTIIDTLVTDANGEAVSQDLYCGTYVVRETVTQNGYLMNENEYEVVITDDGVEENKKPVEQVIEDKPVLRPVKVTKLDADSKNPAGENFEFEVVAKSILDGSGNVREGYEEGTVIDTLVTDASGEAVSKDLYCGTYVVRETVNQNGYLMNENEYEVVVTDDGVEENKTPAWQVVEDEPMLKQIAVTKIDAATGDHCGAGFQFQIVVAEDCVDGSGNVREGFERDSVVEIITTDEDGIARSGDLYLGHYYVQEIAVTEDGYAINATKYPFTLEDHEEDDEVMCVEMNVADKPTTVELYKTDTLEGQPMAGVTFQIRGKDSEASESTSYVTDKDGKIKVEYLKPGTYLIQETATLPGYNLDDTVYEFTVDEYGLIDGNWLYTIKLSNVPDVVEIHKTDITTAKELPGAKLVITDQDGTVVDEWVSEETPHVITGLPAGTYHLTETSAPEGYETEEQITFTLTDSLEIQQVFMKDSPYREVTVSKQDITGSEELPGATLAVTDEDGNLVDEWVSAEEPHKLNLHSGKYILTEKAPADGYVTTDSIMFEVIKTTAEDFLVYPVVMKDERTKLEISKKDLVEGDDGAEVPGAKLEIQDKDGNVVEEWVSTEEPHYVELLPIGKYTLAETAAPDGYEVAEKVTFEITDTADIQKCVMKDKPHRWVEISKLDMAGEEEVYGAHLKLEDLDGNLIEEWVSGDDGEYPDIYSGRPGPDGAESTEHVYGEFDVKPHMVRLPAGTYVLTETKPADGYVTADAITFEVTERGTEGDYEVQKVSMFDDVTKVEISKQDVTNKKELPGAKLEIRDKDGKLVEEWVSTKDPHYIEKLPVGDYTLTETTAPDGYEVSETVEFTVQDTGEVQHVTMYDAPEVEVPKTGDSLGWGRIGTALAAIAALIAAAYFLLRKNGEPEGDPDDGADGALGDDTKDDTEDGTEE